VIDEHYVPLHHLKKRPSFDRIHVYKNQKDVFKKKCKNKSYLKQGGCLVFDALRQEICCILCRAALYLMLQSGNGR